MPKAPAGGKRWAASPARKTRPSCDMAITKLVDYLPREQSPWALQSSAACNSDCRATAEHVPLLTTLLKLCNCNRHVLMPSAQIARHSAQIQTTDALSTDALSTDALSTDALSTDTAQMHSAELLYIPMPCTAHTGTPGSCDLKMPSSASPRQTLKSMQWSETVMQASQATRHHGDLL